MLYVFAALEALAAAWLQAYYLLGREKQPQTREQIIQWLRKNPVWVFSQLVFLEGFALFTLIYPENQTIGRQMILLPFLWLLARVDGKEQVLPNKVVLGALAARILLLAAEVVKEPLLWKNQLVFFAQGFFGILFLMLVLYALTRQSLGEGDVKLYAIMGAYLGFNSTLNVLLLTMFLIGGTGVVGVMLKKLEWKSQLPIGPFTLGAFLLFYFGSALGGILF